MTYKRISNGVVTHTSIFAGIKKHDIWQKNDERGLQEFTIDI